MNTYLNGPTELSPRDGKCTESAIGFHSCFSGRRPFPEKKMGILENPSWADLRRHLLARSSNDWKRCSGKREPKSGKPPFPRTDLGRVHSQSHIMRSCSFGRVAGNVVGASASRCYKFDHGDLKIRRLQCANTGAKEAHTSTGERNIGSYLRCCKPSFLGVCLLWTLPRNVDLPPPERCHELKLGAQKKP